MEKFYIIEVRNEQLGCSFSAVKVAEAEVSKACINAAYEDLGEKRSLQFALEERAGAHYCTTPQKCARDGYTYLGFSTKEKVVKELTRWSKLLTASGKRAKEALEILKNY